MSGSQFDHEPHIETTSGQRLIIMANQIGRAFAAQPHDRAVAGAADHIAKYWDPRMRANIRAHVDAGGAGLDAIAKDAVAALKR